MAVFFLFLLATSLGSLSTLYWIREEELGRGYFQTNALVILGLLTVAAAVGALHPSRPFGPAPLAGGVALALALVGTFLYYGAVWRQRWRLGRWPLTLAAAGTLGALLLCGYAVVPVAASPWVLRGVLLPLALVGSALLLGWSLIAMLLGHWYLVAPKLTFRHLVTFCWVLVAVVVVRLASVGGALVVAASAGGIGAESGGTDPQAVMPLALLTGFAGQGIFFWFRLLWGLVVPLALALMALHCARHRSNQSATGILYVLVVGTFVGEVTAYYLMLTTGIPV